MEKRIKVRVKKGGKVELEANGFQGQECRNAATMVMAAIGGANVIGEEDRDSYGDDMSQYLNY